MARDVTIRYIGDSRSAERAARNVGQANDKMSRKFGGLATSFKRLGIAAGVGLAGAGVLAVKFGMDFVTAAEESIKVSKQTNAVLKSTAGVANVTAKEVDKLVEQLSIKAGVDDELIQSGANVLLTFTNIRNEVGKGNDIFDQATTVALDMSTALGTDLQSSIIQVGKALQDPVRGITALRRVGVNFSTSQVEMIKKLVETGDLLGAQKLILQELTTEFGGSAEAQATASGKLTVAWDNLKEKLGTELLPVMERFSDWMVEKGIPKIQEFADWIKTSLVPALGDLKTWVETNVIPPLQSMWRVLNDNILPVFEAVARFIDERLVPAFSALGDAVTGSNDEAKKSGPSWEGWAVAIGIVTAAVTTVLAKLGLLSAAWGILKTGIGLVGVAFTTVWQLIVATLPFAHIAALAFIFRDQIVDAFTFIKNTLVEAWDALTAFLRSKWSESLEGIKRGWGETWAAIWSGLQAGWEPIGSWFSGLPARFKGYFVDAIDWLFLGGKNIMRGLSKGIKEIWSGIVDWFGDLPGKVLSALGINSPPQWAIDAGKWILKGITKGLGLGVGSVWTFMGKLAGGFTGTLKDAWNSLADFFMGGDFGRGGFGGLVDWFGAIVAKIINQSGGQIWLVSGYRSRAKQEELYAQYAARGFTGAPVARPGSSYHEKGLAADFGGNMALLSQLARAAGLIAPVRGEPWHWQPAGTSGGRSYYGSGGVVPGPVGLPHMAVVHGGENILSVAQRRWFGGGLSSRGHTTVVHVHVAGSVIAERELVGVINRQLDRGARIGRNGRSSL